MSRQITLTGKAALTAQKAICEVRKIWPALESLDDSEVLTLLVAAGLLNEESAHE